jgi:hypothetical protein
VREASEKQTVLLDACTLLNLYATSCLEEILAGLEHRFGVVEYVMRSEALFIERPDHVPPDREQVDVGALVERGLVEIVEIASESEAELFLQLATELDDGEARTLAIAASRGWSVATDDRKAQRVAARECPQVTLFTSLELLKEWVDANGIDAARIGELLLNIRDRANFIPGKHDPMVFWWRSLSGPGQD